MSTTRQARRLTARASAAGLLAIGGLLLAACGSTASPAPGQAAATTAVAASPLGTSVATTSATWATVVMGGSAAQHNNFWQVFVRPAGSARWQLVTPPGTADNGGLVLAPGSGAGVIAAFRPSQLLTYTPLSQTSDVGRTWSAIDPLDAALASTPSALAEQPGGDQLIALDTDGTAEETTAGSAAWHTLASTRSVAATPAGRRCGLTALTVVAWPTGAPLLAGTCTHAGSVGIFAHRNGTWQAAGPTLPASLAGLGVSVARIVVAGSQTVALLQVGGGRTARLIAAWTGGGSTHWTLSPPLNLQSADPASASFGPGGLVALITSAGHGAVISSSGTFWHQLPALPAGTATLAPGSGGQVDALAVHGGTLTVWRLAPNAPRWTHAQAIKVPIPYGSSS
jgi:hypothetical protein